MTGTASRARLGVVVATLPLAGGDGTSVLAGDCRASARRPARHYRGTRRATG